MSLTFVSLCSIRIALQVLRGGTGISASPSLLCIGLLFSTCKSDFPLSFTLVCGMCVGGQKLLMLFWPGNLLLLHHYGGHVLPLLPLAQLDSYHRQRLICKRYLLLTVCLCVIIDFLCGFCRGGRWPVWLPWFSSGRICFLQYVFLLYAFCFLSFGLPIFDCPVQTIAMFGFLCSWKLFDPCRCSFVLLF